MYLGILHQDLPLVHFGQSPDHQMRANIRIQICRILQQDLNLMHCGQWDDVQASTLRHSATPVAALSTAAADGHGRFRPSQNVTYCYQASQMNTHNILL